MIMSTATKTEAGQAKKIGAKQAVAAALKYFGELFPHSTYFNVLLEELEGSEDEDYWFVTIGFDSRPTLPVMGGKMAEIFGKPPARHYKTFKVSATSGKITSMKIRTIG